MNGTGESQVEGIIVESDPPRRLVNTWAAPGATDTGGASVVTFDIREFESIVRLTVTDADLESEEARAESIGGWAAVLSNLKTCVETGRPLSVAPWTVS